jgi:hypothetical protein
MKNNKKRFFGILVFFLFCSTFSYSQLIGDGEFMFVNKSNNQITVKIYPNGAIFNGNYEYNLYASNRVDNNPNNIYIYPVYEYTLMTYQNGTYFKTANFDRDNIVTGCDFSLGYGSYTIKVNDGINPENLFYINFNDANFGNNDPFYYQKLRVDYYGYNNITYNFIDYDGITNFSPVVISNENTIMVWELLGTPHANQLTRSRGNFTDASIQDFHNWPVNAVDYYALGHDNPTFVVLNLKLTNHDASMYVPENTQIEFWKCIFEITNGMTFNVDGGLNWGGQLLVDGPGAKFVIGNNSNIIFNNGTWLHINYEARIEASNSTFQSPNPGLRWPGISLTNTGGGYIDNCTFMDAATSLYLENNGNNFISITNNSFRNNYYHSIQSTKDYNMLISNNHFWLITGGEGFSDGIYIFQQASSEEDNNIGQNYNIRIIENNFHGGRIHFKTIGFASELLPVYLRGNSFYDGYINISLSSSTGSILNNYFNNTSTNNAVEIENISLNYSNPDLLSNSFTCNYNNIELFNSNRANLAPLIQDDGSMIWVAGRNSLTSINYENIHAWGPNAPSYFITDYGNNSFDLENQNDYHFYGYLNTSETIYPSSGNCWFLYGSNIAPRYTLINNDGIQMTLQQNPPPMSCTISDYQVVDRIITDRGNGIYDTVLITQSNNVTPTSDDEVLYASGEKNKLLKNYSNAISYYKNLVNNYPNSKYSESAIFKLYECYVSSDTNHNQGWRNIIFGDLKNYFEDKVQQYDSSETFVNLAFEFFLKTAIKKKSYQLAMDGYEFIAENSPSATERLMASINYIDIEGLLQGSGGGQRENQEYKDELSSDKNGKPIKDILMASYDKTKKATERKENIDLQNSNDVSRTKAELDRKHSTDKKLYNRALENINISSNLNKEERRERIQKDLMLLTSRETTSDNIVKKNNIEPIKYELSQNYPNPFNPITNIKYQIQKPGLVTLKIYDITGREIKTLVNEIKNPGSYIVTFNGSEFASGVYFYRIQAGDFAQVKKMVLIK